MEILRIIYIIFPRDLTGISGGFRWRQRCFSVNNDGAITILQRKQPDMHLQQSRVRRHGIVNGAHIIVSYLYTDSPGRALQRHSYVAELFCSVWWKTTPGFLRKPALEIDVGVQRGVQNLENWSQGYSSTWNHHTA